MNYNHCITFLVLVFAISSGFGMSEAERGDSATHTVKSRVRGAVHILIYTMGMVGTTTLSCGFSQWRDTPEERAFWPGGERAVYFAPKKSYFSEKKTKGAKTKSRQEERAVQCTNVYKHPVIVTHNFENAAFITSCYKEHERSKDLWIITSARPLEHVYTSLFYEKFYYAHENTLGMSTEEKALWFVDHVTPQIRSYNPRAAELRLLSDKERLRRNSRKCHFFADLAALVTPSLREILAAHQRHDPSFGNFSDGDIASSLLKLYHYDKNHHYALLHQGATHEFNVLALKLEDIMHWEEVIRSTVPGWQDYKMCKGYESSSERFQYQRVKEIVSRALRPENNKLMMSCDTFRVFYPERVSTEAPL